MSTYHDAATGRFVSEGYASRNPSTTVEISHKSGELQFRHYQAIAATTAIYPGSSGVAASRADALTYLALGLTSEAGEVAGKIKKILRDQKGVVSDEALSNVLAEVGDVLWYISEIARIGGKSLDILAADNLEKLLDRKARGVLGGSGDKR